MNDETLDLVIFSFFARLKRQCRDRRAHAAANVEIHHATGAPVNSGALVARNMAVGGTALALQTLLDAERYAQGLIRRKSDDALSESGTVALFAIPREQWTPEEADAVSELTYRIKRRCHYWANKHQFFNVDPVAGMDADDPAPFPRGEDGMSLFFTITPDGLEHALKVTEGTRFEKGPTNVGEDLGREAMKDAPSYLKGN